MRFRSRAEATATQMSGTFSDEAFRDRKDIHRQKLQHLAEGSNWPRIDLADLRFGRHWVEDVRTGETYRVHRGELLDANFSPVVAWAITPDGPVFLEPGPKRRAAT